MALDLDRTVSTEGAETGSSSHRMLGGEASPLRDGALNPRLSGPLGASPIQLLTDPDAALVLDPWLDADGKAKGGAKGALDGE